MTLPHSEKDSTSTHSRQEKSKQHHQPCTVSIQDTIRVSNKTRLEKEEESLFRPQTRRSANTYSALSKSNNEEDLFESRVSKKEEDDAGRRLDDRDVKGRGGGAL